MPTVETVLATYDYKYETRLWRKDVAETFQQKKRTITDYTVFDGQILKTVETIFDYASAEAARSPQLPDPPVTFLYIDGKYYKNEAHISQRTHVKTTTYEAYGENSYLLTIEDYDVLRGTVTREQRIIDGKIPLAPTVNSSLTALIQQPGTGTLDENCDSIETRTVINNVWIEDGEDASRVAKRKRQRETAITRRVKHAANPLMELGHTLRLIDRKRGLDKRHVITRKSMSGDEAGGADQTTEAEDWFP